MSSMNHYLTIGAAISFSSFPKKLQQHELRRRRAPQQARCQAQKRGRHDDDDPSSETGQRDGGGALVGVAHTEGVGVVRGLQSKLEKVEQERASADADAEATAAAFASFRAQAEEAATLRKEQADAVS